MPKRIDPREPTKAVSFTMTETDLQSLNNLAKRAGINRSAWIRKQIRTHAPITSADDLPCDHLPLVRDETSSSPWARMGKTNPARNGGHCVGCWGISPPTRRKTPYGKSVWTLDDGTEVIV